MKAIPQAHRIEFSEMEREDLMDFLNIAVNVLNGQPIRNEEVIDGLNDLVNVLACALFFWDWVRVT